MKNNQCKCKKEKQDHPADQLTSVIAKINLLSKLRIDEDALDDDYQHDFEFFCWELKKQIEHIQDQL